MVGRTGVGFLGFSSPAYLTRGYNTVPNILSIQEMSEALAMVEPSPSYPAAWEADKVGDELIGSLLKVSDSLPTEAYPNTYKILTIEGYAHGPNEAKIEYSFHAYHAGIRRVFNEDADSWVGSLIGIKYKGVNSKKAGRHYKEFTYKIFPNIT